MLVTVSAGNEVGAGFAIRPQQHGQKRPVTAIIPLVPKTIDEDLYRLLDAKTDIENDLIDASQDERVMMNAVCRTCDLPEQV